MNGLKANIKVRSHKRQTTVMVGMLASVLAAIVAISLLYPAASVTPVVSAAVIDSTFSDAEDAYAEGVVEIDLSELASLDADEVEVEDGVLKIGAAGVYSLTGTLVGSIEVDTKGKVYLELNGVRVTSVSGPALRVKNAKRVTLILAQGTSNSLADVGTGDVGSATLLSDDDLYLTGSGALTVAGNNGAGISSNDGIVVNNGTIVVTAVGDGLAAHDDITVNGGDLTVTAGGDGLDSGGTVHVSGGGLVAFGGTAFGEGGVDAYGEFTITGGTVVAGGNLLVALGDDSRQCSVFVTSPAILPGGTALSLVRDGQQVFSFTPPVAYQNVLISSGDLTSGVAYQAYLGTELTNLVLASR